MVLPLQYWPRLGKRAIAIQGQDGNSAATRLDRCIFKKNKVFVIPLEYMRISPESVARRVDFSGLTNILGLFRKAKLQYPSVVKNPVYQSPSNAIKEILERGEYEAGIRRLPGF
jgi:hypothetical protein